MYDASPDPYCYPGTRILKNIPDIRDEAALRRFEAAITAQRSDEPFPAGRLSIRHYRAVHRHLFQDVYGWAGQFRTVRLSKGDSMFCYPEHIAGEMRRLFAALKDGQYLRGLSAGEFARAAAHFLAELNAIHPFREGNGRAQLSFLSIVADRAGHPLNFAQLDPEAFLAAMIESFAGREGPLAIQVLDLIEP